MKNHRYIHAKKSRFGCRGVQLAFLKFRCRPRVSFSLSVVLFRSGEGILSVVGYH